MNINKGLVITLVVIILLVIITIFSSVTTVPTGYVGVKTRFGQVQDNVIQEGLNIKTPFIEKIVKIDCRTQKCEYTMEASSKDLQVISNLKISVNYNVNKEYANKLYREVGTDYVQTIIEPTIFDAVKNTIANYTAEQLITQRSEVSAMCTEALYGRLNDRGIQVTSFNILDLSFSADFDAAIERKQVVEQETKTAQLELEKAKIENEKKIENAKAEAEVMKQQNAQITDNTLRLKELEVKQNFINKWNGQLPTTTTDDILSILGGK